MDGYFKFITYGCEGSQNLRVLVIETKKKIVNKTLINGYAFVLFMSFLAYSAIRKLIGKSKADSALYLLLSYPLM